MRGVFGWCALSFIAVVRLEELCWATVFHRKG